MFDKAEIIKQASAQITPIALGYRATLGPNATNDNWTLALVFFENLLVARMKGEGYRDLFFNPQANDAFSAGMTNTLADFRKLVSYANADAATLTWNQPLDMVLNGQAAMTIMGDWGKGYAKAYLKANNLPDTTYGVIPMPGTAGTFVFTTDTFGLPISARPIDDTMNLLRVFGSRPGQDIFNPLKGSISARSDSMIDNGDYDAMAQQTFQDYRNANTIVPATSILAPQTYVDAISKALADFAGAGDAANPSTVQHTLDDYQDILRKSCWPTCRPVLLQ
jgi:glucose/mannose transport system substrate-binding protein